MIQVGDHKPVAIDDEQQRISHSAAVEEVNQQDLKEDDRNDRLVINEMVGREDTASMKDNDGQTTQLGNNDGLGITTVASSEDESSVGPSKVHKSGKRISRIEDSVEALDALEEEIEKIGGLMPEPAEVQSIKTKKQTTRSPNTLNVKPKTPLNAGNRTNMAAKPANKGPATGDRLAKSRPPTQPASNRKTNPLPGRGMGSKREMTAKKENAVPKAASASTQAVHKRVSSIHKPPFQPAKSTKPPTRATFELPGDAISRKLKEQREERLKREEEENPKRHVFKARPIRRSEAPEVRLTAAAKARLSIARGETLHPAATKFEAPKPWLSVTPGSVAPAGANKRHSSLSVAKRSSHPPPPRPSTGVTRAPSLRASCNNRIPSVANASRSAPTAEDLAHQKVKGKEVFGRTKMELQEREQAKKDKEEAAKKARAEAAERGRIASRAWAEQQKLRKQEAEKAKNKPKMVEA